MAAVCEPPLRVGDALPLAAHRSGVRAAAADGRCAVSGGARGGHEDGPVDEVVRRCIEISTLEVSPTNKDFYRAHKFKPTGLAPRRAEYAIWRKDM